jgi:hypothetical protein
VQAPNQPSDVLDHIGPRTELIVPLAKAEEAQLVSALSETEQAELTRLMIKLAKAACPDRDLW